MCLCVVCRRRRQVLPRAYAGEFDATLDRTLCLVDCARGGMDAWRKHIVRHWQHSHVCFAREAVLPLAVQLEAVNHTAVWLCVCMYVCMSVCVVVRKREREVCVYVGVHVSWCMRPCKCTGLHICRIHPTCSVVWLWHGMYVCWCVNGWCIVVWASHTRQRENDSVRAYVWVM